jgi:eukaryotic-like serine/threonine-protein kinase
VGTVAPALTLRPAEPPPILRIGQIVGESYEVRSLLGSGGMGQVFEAHDRELNRRVAIKVALRPEDAPFLRLEGQALAAIRHPSIVTVYTKGQHEGLDFLVLERVFGTSLEDVIEQRRRRGERMGLDEVIDLLVRIGEGLAIVHRAGLSHRDVKPANVMIAAGGRVVLMDFGLVLPDAERPDTEYAAGSLEFMAPEALQGKVVRGMGHLLDVWSLGVVAYQLVGGILPYSADDPAQLLARQLWGAPVSLARLRREAPKGLVDLVHALLAVDPAERPQSIDAVVWSLRSIREVVEATKPPPFTVLILCADTDVADMLALYVRLVRGDAEIHTVSDESEALKQMRKRPPTVLVVDLDDRRANGVEVIMYLRGSSGGDRANVIALGNIGDADAPLLKSLDAAFFPKGTDLMTGLVGHLEKLRSTS